MIAVEARGRLGNQMFQWAFGFVASRRLDTRFAMGHEELSPLFELDGFRRPWRRFERLWWLARDRLQKRPVVEIDDENEPELTLEALRDGVRYRGFFQSADYFSGHEDAVRGALTIRPEHRRRFEERFGDLASDDYVCVHIRRGDYLKWEGVGIALPWSFTRRCIDLVNQDLPIVFISDDISAVQANLGSYGDARFESNEPIVDLQLMTRAKVCIVSNSSFGWWGAWLNQVPEKRVLAPRYWMGFRERRELPPHVIPDDWEQVDVEHGKDPIEA